MTKYKSLNKKEYVQIKALLDAGVPVGVLGKMMERSQATISNIKRSKDFDDYHVIIRSYYAPKPKSVVIEEAKIEQHIDEVNETEPTHLPKVQAHDGTEATSLLRIANALERMADAWESKPKGIFNR